MKISQKQLVYEIVQDAGSFGIRTEKVKIQAMLQGCSCADRFLRWLAELGKIVGRKENGNHTKTWYVKQDPMQLSIMDWYIANKRSKP